MITQNKELEELLSKARSDHNAKVRQNDFQGFFPAGNKGNCCSLIIFYSTYNPHVLARLTELFALLAKKFRLEFEESF